jgi:hypothetical protein
MKMTYNFKLGDLLVLPFLVGLPQGVTEDRPPELFPSPPP